MYICTSIYESAKRTQVEFIDSLMSLDIISPVGLLIIEDNYQLEPSHYRILQKKFDLKRLYISKKIAPICVKKILLSEAMKLPSDMLIFSDFDDMLETSAIDSHYNNLKNFDFSYGDQALVDSNGISLNTNLFDQHSVPEVLKKSEEVFFKNYCGFSAFGVNQSSLSRIDIKEISEKIEALDWFLVTMMLLKNMSGKKTTRSVVKYRQTSWCFSDLLDDEKILYIRKNMITLLHHYNSFNFDAFRNHAKYAQEAINFSRLNPEIFLEVIYDCSYNVFPWFCSINKIIFKLNMLREAL